MEICKHYKVVNWCQYEELSLIGDVSGLTLQPNYGAVTTTGGHSCNYQTWLNEDTGEGTTISTERAKKEIEKHSACWDEFVQDMGLRNSYEAQAVLVWLGY